MDADKIKRISVRKQKKKAGKEVVPSQDTNTAILRDVKEELTND